MFPTIPLHTQTEAFLTQINGKSTSITKTNSLGGGSINHAFRVETTAGKYFVKTNSKSRYPEMFQKEVKGLELLKKAESVLVPDVIGIIEDENNTGLILEYIERGAPNNRSFHQFGEQLAKQHLHTNDTFGLEYNNYIGSLIQNNEPAKDGIGFLTNNRLLFQGKMAMEKRLFSKPDFQLLEHFCESLKRLIPEEPPALLHGDLWSGNFLFSTHGAPYIFDPAVYFGHREMDIAMTYLFGGFDEDFYEGYQSVYPLEKNWKIRIEIFQLYPLLVHLNLFGESYLSQIRNILNHYT